MSMEHADLVPRYLAGYGVEIGAFKTPIPGISPVYIDRFAEYAGEPTSADYYGDACDLPFYDSSVRYVATSHVLEHVANPLAAISEWFRVIKHGGYIYMVVPDRNKTFDHPRPLTEVEHLLCDYRNRVTQSDATHIDDFVYGVDWSMYSPMADPSNEACERDELASRYHRAVEADLEINIHFHTFECARVADLIRIGNLESLWAGRIEIVEKIEDFPGSNPNGFLIVARIVKPPGVRWRSLFSPKGLTADARKLAQGPREIDGGS